MKNDIYEIKDVEENHILQYVRTKRDKTKKMKMSQMENMNIKGFPEAWSRTTEIEETSKDKIKGNILNLENDSK